MADIFLHNFVERIRGKFGRIVVKQMFGRTFIARPPTVTTAEPSVAQVDTRKRFAKASAYAKAALKSPTARAYYTAAAKAKQTGLFAVAAGDYLKSPTVDEINLDEYKGLVGDKLTILALDDVGVTSIDVAIRVADGSYIEQGPASNADGPWVYTATTQLPPGQQVTIEAFAKDRPGNIGEGFTNYTRNA
jgi:hypothetical protein